MFYWFLKFIALGPLLKVIFRPRAEGVDNVPPTGPAILASNHLSYADWLFMPLVVPRKVSFVAKAEYFTTPGFKGWLQKQFFSGTGNIPIDRESANAAAGALVSSGSSRMREGARRSSMIWAKTDNATSSGVRAPMSSPAGA